MDYRLEFTQQAQEDLEQLPTQIIKRLLKKLDYFVHTPYPLYFAKPLTNSTLGDYRFRIGDYRVIVRVHNDIIYVLKIGHRREIYK